MVQHHNFKGLLVGVGSLTLFILLFVPVLANNPNGSNPYWTGRAGEVVDMYSGELMLSVTDVSLPSRGGLSLSFTRTYNSEMNYLNFSDDPDDTTCGGKGLSEGKPKGPIPLGAGWNMPIMRLLDDFEPYNGEANSIMYSTGKYESFVGDGNNRKKTREFAVLTDNNTLTYPDGTKYEFDPVYVSTPEAARGRYLLRITDATGQNHINYIYNYSTGRLDEINDSLGRYIKIDYVNNLIARVRYTALGGGEDTVSYSYEYGNLEHVTYPDGKVLTYTYVNGWYCGNDSVSSGGNYFLRSITLPTYGKIKFTFDHFVQRVYNDCGDSVMAFSNNAAVKRIDYDSLGTVISSVLFKRSYASSKLTSKVAEGCDTCSSGNYLIKEWQFYAANNGEGGCPNPVASDFGLPESLYVFVGTLSSEPADSQFYMEDYTGTYVPGGWDFVDLGEGTMQPFLESYGVHIPGTNPDSFECPQALTEVDPATGITTQYRAYGYNPNQDSLYSIAGIYNSTQHRYYLQTEHFDGFETRYTYPGGGNPTSMLPESVQKWLVNGGTQMRQLTTRYNYDDWGNVTATYDSLGQRDTTFYESTTHTFPDSIKTRDGLKTSFNYDRYTGLLKSTTGPTGIRVSNEYDPHGRLVGVWRKGPSDTDSLKISKISYWIPARTVVTYKLYDTSGLYDSTKSVVNIWGQPQTDTLYNFDNNHDVVTERRYNRLGQLRRTTRPYFSSNPNDTLWTAFRYDFLGRTMEVNAPNTANDGGGTSENVSTTKYFGKTVTSKDWVNRGGKTVSDKYGRVTKSYYYDSTGTVKYLDSSVTAYLGITGLPITVTDAANQQTAFEYDKFRRVYSVTKPGEGTSKSYFDKLGNLKFSRNALNEWTTYKYDDMYRLVELKCSTLVPDTTQLESIGYLPNGSSKAKYLYGRYDVTQSTVDTLGWYYETSKALDSVNAVAWIKGMLTEVIDPACTTLFVYDQYGRTKAKIVNFCRVKKWGTTYFYPGRKIINYGFSDATDQMASILYPRETTSDTARIRYDYYKSGILKNVPHFTASSNTIEYEPWGATRRIKYGNDLSQIFKYDSLSRITRNATAYTNGGDGALFFGERYGYNAHRLTRVYSDTGFYYSESGSVPPPVLAREYAYDYRERLETVNYLRNGEVARYDYQYSNANNRRVEHKLKNGQNSYLYSGYYNQDSTLNRLRIVSSNVNDTTSGIRFTYDTMGRLTGDTLRQRQYSYDYRNMIDTLTLRSSAGAYLRDTIMFFYNYKNQRVVKMYKYWYLDDGDCEPIEPDPGGGSESVIPGGGGTTDDLGGMQTDGIEPPQQQCPYQAIRIEFYVWSGNEVIAEYSDSLLDCQYVYANGMRIAQMKVVGYGGEKDTVYLHSDYQGSTRLTTSRTQAILSRTDYDVWGQVRQQSGTPSAYTYTGQEWDDEGSMNLFYMNARYYDPTIGRFTTPDPLPSDLNPYSYCNNNPAILIDPSGMVPTPLPIDAGAPVYRGFCISGRAYDPCAPRESIAYQAGMIPQTESVRNMSNEAQEQLHQSIIDLSKPDGPTSVPLSNYPALQQALQQQWNDAYGSDLIPYELYSAGNNLFSESRIDLASSRTMGTNRGEYDKNSDRVRFNVSSSVFDSPQEFVGCLSHETFHRERYLERDGGLVAATESFLYSHYGYNASLNWEENGECVKFYAMQYAMDLYLGSEGSHRPWSIRELFTTALDNWQDSPDYKYEPCK